MQNETAKYTIGLDFGTLSVRAVLMAVTDGSIVASETFNYPHGVITDNLPGSTETLKDYWCLQDPTDYLSGMIETVSTLTKIANGKGILTEQIVAVGVDFTCCTVLPVYKDGSALASSTKWRGHPHSWVKLWKHHAAQPQADRINQLASERQEDWLPFYGGKVSSEWFFPKLLQILEEDSAVYDEMDKFIEAGDWIVWQLTGKEMRNQASAGYKAFYQESLGGFPSPDFFKALNPAFENVVEEKIKAQFYAPGTKAGQLTTEMAKALHLSVDTVVSVNHIDAHVCVAATDVTVSNTMLNIIGTSSVDVLLSDHLSVFPGIAGLVNNGAIANLFAYETGQGAVGDIFEWFVKNNVNPTYYEKAKSEGVNIYQYLTKESEKILPGESGVMALDWWNGNRSILMDGNLTGLILGLTLQTKPAEIFRALIEATAFGKKIIVDNFENNGVKIDSLVFCGGIPYKNKLLNQIYADVLDKPIIVSNELEAAAKSSAIFATLACGEENGGYSSIQEAVSHTVEKSQEVYQPNPENTGIYQELFELYKRLSDDCSQANSVMKKVLWTRFNQNKN